MVGVVQVRNLMIGDGETKICVPIMGRTGAEIEAAARRLQGHPFDIVEWRADYFDGVKDVEQVKMVLRRLRVVLEEVPLLFTIRTKDEGGSVSISYEEYILVNMEVANSHLADLIDVETARGDDIAFVVIEAAHAAGVKVIASRHYFNLTPKKEEMIMRMCKMQDLEADIVKLAVMPQSDRDVLALLDATLVMKELHNETPVVTMAMGAQGAITRVAGKTFGSAMSFGSVAQASAPGQIPAEQLKMVLETI